MANHADAVRKSIQEMIWYRKCLTTFAYVHLRTNMLDGLFKRRAAITSPCLACPSQTVPNDDDWRHLPKGIIYLSPSQTIKVNLLTKKHAMMALMIL